MSELELWKKLAMARRRILACDVDIEVQDQEEYDAACAEEAAIMREMVVSGIHPFSGAALSREAKVELLEDMEAEEREREAEKASRSGGT